MNFGTSLSTHRSCDPSLQLPSFAPCNACGPRRLHKCSERKIVNPSVLKIVCVSSITSLSHVPRLSSVEAWQSSQNASWSSTVLAVVGQRRTERRPELLVESLVMERTGDARAKSAAVSARPEVRRCVHFVRCESERRAAVGSLHHALARSLVLGSGCACT